MRILWNENEKQFEAQFSQGDQWQSDKDLADASGFSTDGPPAWIWRTTKAATLTKLQKTYPAGVSPSITITRTALDAYNHLRAIEERDAELRKFAKEQKKLQKKEQERSKIAAQHEEGDEIEPEYEPTCYREIPVYWTSKTEITRAGLPGDILARFVRHESFTHQELWAKPIGVCTICGDNLYFPEEPPVCFWCDGLGKEKFFEELLDN